MASVSFPLMQKGTVSAPSTVANVRFDRIETSREELVESVTGSSGGAVDTAVAFVHGLPTQECVGYGHLQLDSDGSQSLAQSSTMAPGLTIRPGYWKFRRVWPLFDVTGGTTGSADTEKNWTWGMNVDMVQVAGWATSSGPGFSTNSVTVSTVIDDFGTVSGTLKLDAKRLNSLIVPGGPMPVSFAGRYSGAVSYTGSNFSWLFPTAPADPVKAVLTVTNDTAETIANSVLVYDFELELRRSAGGKIPFTMRMRFDQAP